MPGFPPGLASHVTMTKSHGFLVYIDIHGLLSATCPGGGCRPKWPAYLPLSTPDFQKCVRFSITLQWHDVGQAIQGVRDNQRSANGSKKTWMTMTKHGEDEDHTCQRGNEEQSARITPTMEAGERTFPFHFIISPCSKPTACAYCAY